jgi:Protein of unknown function (DUF1569)
MTPGRRTLRYGSLDEIMPDVERLLEGHTTVGGWTVAQICRHLATIMRRTVDLPASTPLDASRQVGEEWKRQFFESGVVPEGIPTSPSLLPADALDEREEAEGLRQAIAYYQASPGPVVPHVLFGVLTREEWDRFHCLHAAHHFSFAVPKGAPR